MVKKKAPNLDGICHTNKGILILSNKKMVYMGVSKNRGTPKMDGL